MEASSCCVCLNSASILSKITEKANENEILTPIYKLLICVPDIKLQRWLQIDQICNLCQVNLNKTYDFREMCFNSEFLRCEIKIEDVKVETLDDDEIGDMKPPVENRQLRNVCNICSNITDSLSNISENAKEEKLPSISKLKILIKNIGWSDSYDICNLCEDRLNEAYDFYELCMKNQFNSSESKQIKIEPIDNDNVKIESSKLTLLDNVCTYCESIFDSKQQLIVHLRAEHPNKIGRSKQQTNIYLNRFKCEHCKKPFKSNKSLRNHLARKHNIDRKKVLKHECHLCLKRFYSPTELKTHLNGVHSNIFDLKCEPCNKAFKYNKSLRIHLATKHNNDRKKVLKHECHLCSKQYYSPNELKSHLSGEHSNISGFKCEQCEKAFKSNRTLRVHLAAKHNIDRKTVLKQECHLCSKRFYSPTELKAHIKGVHLKSSNLKCEHCHKVFKYDRSLRIHMAIRHNIDRKTVLKHECHLCSERFYQLSEVKLHLRKVHLF